MQKLDEEYCELEEMYTKKQKAKGGGVFWKDTNTFQRQKKDSLQMTAEQYTVAY